MGKISAITVQWYLSLLPSYFIYRVTTSFHSTPCNYAVFSRINFNIAVIKICMQKGKLSAIKVQYYTTDTFDL